MKHHLLKSVILSLILVMGVSNAWAKRYYFEVPSHWDQGKVYKLRLYTGENNPNGWSRALQKLEGTTNTYYYDNPGYTHVQFCQMKEEYENEMNVNYTKYHTTKTAFPQTNENRLKVTENVTQVNDKFSYTIYEAAPWDYQTFTVENVHIIFEASHRFWKYQPTDSEFQNELQPVLLIGDNNSSQTIALTKIQNANNIYHCHIQDPVSFAGYTFIQPAEVDIPDIDDNTLPFHERCALIDQIIDTYHTNIKYNEEETYQDIISKKHEDPRTYNLIVNTTKQRTKSYFEPIAGNTFHCIRLGDFIDSKTYFGDINNLNKNLTMEVKVSYDDGKTYEQTGTLPVDLYSTDQNNYDIKEKIFYFTDSWTNMSQYSTLNLPSGSKTFSYTTPMGYKANNVYITYNIPQENKERYEVVKWIMNNTESYSTNRVYSPGYFEEENPVITLFIKKINNWKCTVTFNTEQLSNITIAPLVVEPNEKIAAPLIDKELQPAGTVCKWYTHATERGEEYEFDFDTRITQDYTLYGAWVPEAEEGDYRLLYVEQVVEKSIASGDEWKTVITRKKAHPSDIIKPSDLTDGEEIVSLHVYNKNTYQAVKNPKATNNEDKYYTSPSNSEVILQRYNGTTWEDKEHHMVFGPMETLPAMAMLPGRRNAEGNAMLKYDEGIPVIQNDTKYNGNGVWNFPIVQSGNGDATLDREHIERYEGTYYIRTANAEGGWNNYTIPANHMTFSEYQASLGLGNEEFTHYFCKWVDLDKLDSKFVHYVVANDYAQAVSDTLIADRTDLFGKPLEANQQIVGNDAVLPTSANIRFSWREENNALHRAYLAPSVSDQFLVLEANDSQVGIFDPTSGKNLAISGLEANEQIFMDDSKWIYHADVQMQPRADIQVTAKYNDITQYFIGDQDKFRNTVLQGTGEQKYLVRLLYDFKNNEIISAYVPGASTQVDLISTNLMIIRQNYGEAKQLVFNNGDMSTRDNRRAYGVIEFTEDYLTNEKIPYLKRCLYWVSFPFNVNLSEAFGSLVYGKHWLIQEYDGARRAAEGLWKESESFWKLHWEPNITLEAGLGYVIEIDINQMIKDNIINTTDGKQQIAALYFPSSTPITKEIIKQNSYTVNIPAHKCEIVHTGTYGDRTIRDSHWNVIGVPSYVNTGATFSDTTYALNEVVKYYYQWQGEVDKYIAMEANKQAYSFQSMYAYMVQYAGDITWNSVLLDEKPAQIAAKKNSVTNEHAMRLELQQNNILLDKTFVRLQDDVATPAFDFNYDLCKITNKGANIYSIITEEASPVDVAANVLPIKETIIPIGIKIDAAGEYTFAMPDGTDGIVVELIDYETNTRTNMLLSDYTITLPKGTNETRFALHVKPNKVVTGLENIGNSVNGLNGETVRKCLIDGVLYLQKGNLLYDAQGRCVQ